MADMDAQLDAPVVVQVARQKKGKGRKRGIAELESCANTADLIAACHAFEEENLALQRAYRTLVLKTLMLAQNDDPIARVMLVTGETEPGDVWHIPPASTENRDAHGGEPCLALCTRRQYLLALKLVIPSLSDEYTIPPVVTRHWETVAVTRDTEGGTAAPSVASPPRAVAASSSSDEITVDDEADGLSPPNNAPTNAPMPPPPAPEWRRELVTKVLAPGSSELADLRPINAAAIDATHGVLFSIAIQVVDTGEIWTADDFPGKDFQEDFLVWQDPDRARDYFHVAPRSSEARCIFKFPHKSTGPGNGRRFRLLVAPSDPVLKAKYPNLSWSSCVFRTQTRVPDNMS